jgi:hypothetical protein
MPAPEGNKYALGNTGGRPRAHPKESLPDLGREMVRFFEDHLDNLSKRKAIPFFRDFARVINVSADTLEGYRKQDEEFFGSYRECKEIQKQAIIVGGLNGYFKNPAFLTFVAKNITDMRERAQTWANETVL